MSEAWGICRAMSWIAFRREDLLTDDPDELRANMKRHKRLLLVKNPARDMLKHARSGDLAIMRHPMLPIATEGISKMSPIDWMQIGEDDIWRKAEFDWQHAQGKIKLEVRSDPALSMLMIADDGREFENMGQAFAEWSDSALSPDDLIKRVYKTGKLDRELCLSFWQWLGRTDPVPNEVNLYLNSREVDAFLATLPKPRRRRTPR